ncbi:uncharacterized protein LOC117151501 [Bombus impatiens]|uniref:Uncharacterized protein LOC117151501 n=1 Tax=Bombus impatiens TaxID=132113 RepID=A0A6P8LR82_BOMIM|nr:uncharacterized protein LOC117151501 [Bombus impatiens]
MHVSTQTSPLIEETGRGNGDNRRGMSSESRNKRKIVSPLEVNEKESNMRIRRSDTSYAEVCGSKKKSAMDTRYAEACESADEWTIQMGRREKRRIKEKIGNDKEDSGPPPPPPTENRGPKMPRVRRRPKTILIKVGEDKEWLQVCKDLMVAKDVLKESSGIRRTRAGDI